MAPVAFDLSERFQTPVFVLSDLDIGMNDWVSPALEWDDSYVPDRGRVLDAGDLRELEVFHRYEPADSESVAARTLPGVSELGAYFTRGSGHTIEGAYTEYPEEYQAVLDRLARKHTAVAEHIPAPVIDDRGNAVWEWQIATGAFGREVSTQRLQKLEHPALSIADEDTRPNAVRVNPLGAKKGYDPYDSGKLGKKPEKQKTDLRKLGEWLKLKKQAEKNKEEEPKD